MTASFETMAREAAAIQLRAHVRELFEQLRVVDAALDREQNLGMLHAWLAKRRGEIVYSIGQSVVWLDGVGVRDWGRG
jgi:hypothetical protein